MTRVTDWIWPLLLGALIVASGAGCSKQTKRNRYLARADRDFAVEQFDRAEVEYLAALKLPPPDPRAVTGLGLIYMLEGRLPQAYAYLHKGVQLRPEDLEARVKLGIVCLSVRSFKEAREQALEVLQRQPGNGDALILLAEAALTTNEVSEAIQRLDQLPSTAKGSAPYHVARGTLWLRQSRWEEAEKEFQAATIKDPKAFEAWLALGNFYFIRNDLKKAESALKTASERAPLRSNARLRYAELELRTGSPQQAKAEIEGLANRAPDYLPAWLFLAKAALVENRQSDCESLVRRMLARDPIYYDGLLLRGTLLASKGDATNAAVQFEKIIQLYGKIPDAQYRLALARIQMGDIPQALANLNDAINGAPGFIEAILLQSSLNIRRGDATSGITALNRLIKQQPQVAQAYLLLANAYLVQNNPDEALDVYGRMSEAFPTNAEVPLVTGILLTQLKRTSEARKSFEKALALSPDYLPAVEKIVDLDLMEKQYEVASGRVRSEIEKHPAAAEPWLLMAKVEMAQAMGYASTTGAAETNATLSVAFSQTSAVQEQANKAEAALLKAIELDPNLRTSYVLLAELYAATKRQQQALDRLALLARTNDVGALMMIGIIQDQQKNFPAARDAYEKLLKVNPRVIPALNNLAFLYSEYLGQHEKAYQMAEQARQLLPYDPYVADTLGWILYKRGEYARAVGLLEESVARLGADPEIQFHLGMAHYMMDEEDPARLALQQAVEAVKDFSGKQQAARHLAILKLDGRTADSNATANLEAALRDSPNDVIALDRLAALYQRDGNFSKARAAYESALQASPQNPRIMAKLANLYAAHLNDPRKALDLAKAAHSGAPENAEISYLLGRLVSQTRDYAWALSLLQDAARKLPNNLDLLYDLAWAYYRLGRVSEAESSMQTAVQAGTGFSRLADAKRFSAMLAAAQSIPQVQTAATEATAILRAEPNYVPALMVVAVAAEHQGDIAHAREVYEGLLARNPLFTPATRNLALLYTREGQEPPKAFELATKAREAYPKDAEIAKALGVLTYRRGDYARAAQLLKESLQTRSDDPELLYYLGMAHFHLKQPTESKLALQRALDARIDDKLADEARRVLAQLN